MKSNRVNKKQSNVQGFFSPSFRMAPGPVGGTVADMTAAINPSVSCCPETDATGPRPRPQHSDLAANVLRALTRLCPPCCAFLPGSERTSQNRDEHTSVVPVSTDTTSVPRVEGNGPKASRPASCCSDVAPVPFLQGFICSSATATRARMRR